MTSIAALCDQQIVALLSDRNMTCEKTRMLLDLANLRDVYANSPDISEMTPQSSTETYGETYGDGTPGAITGGDAADDNKMPDALAGSITSVTRQPGETWRDAFDRTAREARGEEKFGFRIGETVNLKTCRFGDSPGRVVGFTAMGVTLRWNCWPPNHLSQGISLAPEVLRHGP